MNGHFVRRTWTILTALALLAFLSSFVPADREGEGAGVSKHAFRASGGGLIAIMRDIPTRVPFEPRAVTAPAAVFVVNYTGFTAAAQAAFQRAVDILASLITSSVVITVDASFEALPSGVLGAAGPNNSFRNFPGAPRPNTFYPIALANKLAGTDLDPGVSDIGASFSNTFPFYFGLDQNVPSGQFDFITVVLHELLHGLGFVGSGRSSGGVGSWGANVGGVLSPLIFDRHVYNGAGQAFINLALFGNPSAALHAQLTSDNLFFFVPPFTGVMAGEGVSAPAKLFAPANFQQGSSYSHLDESTFPAGNPNSLMTPGVAQQESNHSPGPITLAMFEDMGWTVAGGGPPPGSPPPAPTGHNAQVSGLNVTLSWNASPGATSYQLEAGTSAGLLNVFIGDVGNITSLTTPGPPGTFFTRVRAKNAAGTSGPSNEISFTLGGGPGPCQAPPPAPTGLSFSVSGGMVTLNWNASAGATSYQLEAGSGAGLSNILVSNVGNTTGLVSPAPPGTYFVRIKAVNACGTSGPSNEVVVVVP